jgi:2-hydroxy-6-oxonona-2,4-dienedioate hydrolase
MDEGRYREAERRLWESFGLTPAERRVRLAGAGLTVRVQEVGQGPAVVLVHGTSNSGASWAGLVARLDGFRCVMLDRPGCGLSDPLGSSFDSMERLGTFADALIVDLLDAMGLDRAHLVATSFGGYIALRTAAAHPQRVGRIVEFGWTFGAPVAGLPLLMRLATVPAVGRLMTAVPPNERAVRAMFRRIGLRQALEAGRVSQEAVGCYLALLRDTDTMRNELRAGPRLIHPFRGMDERTLLPADLLARVHTPVFFLWGEEDPFGDAGIAQRFVEQLPNAELELLPGAGHAVWMDDPDRAAKTVRRFLSRP